MVHQCLAVCDGHLQFLFYHVGAQGSCHDARVYRVSTLPEMLESRPEGACILGTPRLAAKILFSCMVLHITIGTMLTASFLFRNCNHEQLIWLF